MHKTLKKVRPRIQRAFFTWFSENHEQFFVPIRIGRRTRRSIELEFAQARSLITATLTSWEIIVSFNWQGECWDLLVCFEAIPELTSDGYVCSLCLPELCWPDARATYSNREQLWREHLFEPFLEWVNDKLAKSPWIGIGGGIKEGMTYAELLVSLPDKQRTNSVPFSKYQIIPNPMCGIEAVGCYS